MSAAGNLAQTASPAAGPLRAPYIVVDDFLPPDLATAMRDDIDAHFAKPGAHRAETHQVWNYWFVPELYTYLRTMPEKVIRRPLVERFVDRLRSWSIQTCGMASVTWPYLSLYVSGCRQGLHNDSANGRFGFVYSLTRNERRTSGGETVILHEGDPFRTKLTQPNAGRGFYDAIEPRFNRLVVFDDRLPHAVERLDGSMDPTEGRFVLHGHLVETGAMVAGPLPSDLVGTTLLEAINRYTAAKAALLAFYHGPLVLRVTINAAGSVDTCAVLLDRVIHPDIGDAQWEPLVVGLMKQLRVLRFPPAPGPTQIIQPLLFGKLLPTR